MLVGSAPLQMTQSYDSDDSLLSLDEWQPWLSDKLTSPLKSAHKERNADPAEEAIYLSRPRTGHQNCCAGDKKVAGNEGGPQLLQKTPRIDTAKSDKQIASSSMAAENKREERFSPAVSLIKRNTNVKTVLQDASTVSDSDDGGALFTEVNLSRKPGNNNPFSGSRNNPAPSKTRGIFGCEKITSHEAVTPAKPKGNLWQTNTSVSFSHVTKKSAELGTNRPQEPKVGQATPVVGRNKINETAKKPRLTIIVISSGSEDEIPQLKKAAGLTFVPSTPAATSAPAQDDVISEEVSFADYSDEEPCGETPFLRKHIPTLELDSSDDDYDVSSGVMVW